MNESRIKSKLAHENPYFLPHKAICTGGGIVRLIQGFVMNKSAEVFFFKIRSRSIKLLSRKANLKGCLFDNSND